VTGSDGSPVANSVSKKNKLQKKRIVSWLIQQQIAELIIIFIKMWKYLSNGNREL
jgi:uncharacterized membrane protein YvbJ